MCLATSPLDTKTFAQELLASIRRRVKNAETKEERRIALLQLQEAEDEYERLAFKVESFGDSLADL